jgi:Fe-S-cluster formation regulator IscX/YfhJ
MWRSKKYIIIAVLAAVVLAGSIGGAVLADDDEDADPCQAHFNTMLDKVCEIYNANTDPDIDREALKDACIQARSEMLPEDMPRFHKIDSEAMQDHLQELFDQGKITQEQFDEMKARLESMPDDAPFGFGFRGMGRPHGFPGPCATTE